MDTTRLSRRAQRLLPVFCLCAAVSIPWAAPGRMTAPDRASGLRLLEAQLPTGSTARQADCERLVRAVRMATLAHHREAAAILAAALTTADGTPKAQTRACECVVQIFRAAVNAAPDHASELLETAEALCPECANGLAAMLGRMEDKNVVADPKDYAAHSGDPAARNDDPRSPSSSYSSDLSERDYQGIGNEARDPGTENINNAGTGTGTGTGIGTGTGTGTSTGTDPGTGFRAGTGSGIGGSDSFFGGFGSGLGPGFPGAPGFSGSSPGGGVSLPRPVAPAVTSVVNG